MTNSQETSLNNQLVEEKESGVAVVVVPFPAQGHINQLLHLSGLISAYNLPIHYVGSATLIRQARSRVHGWDPSTISNIHFQEFSTPTFPNPPPNPHAKIKFPAHLVPSFMASTHLRNPVHAFVQELSTKHKRVVVIHDYYMRYVVQDTDSVPNAEAYCFRCASAFTTLCFDMDRREGNPQSVFPTEVAEILKETPTPDGCVAPEFYEFWDIQRGAKNVSCGTIIDSNREMEGLHFDLVAELNGTKSESIWGLGPFNPVSIPDTKTGRIRHKVLEWLDKQGPDSVIYISFGTMTSLSEIEIKEIASGLERSEQKFIWVLREADRANVFAKDEDRKLNEILPEGFEERVKEKGIIVREWAPQLEILGHRATGAFLSHCGWNSCMESISMGVPIVAWPMHADQPRNAVFVTKVLRIGVEVMKWERRRNGEIVSGAAVEKAVRTVMASEEGEEMRARSKELGCGVRRSVMEGGSTRKEIDSFISRITRI